MKRIDVVLIINGFGVGWLFGKSGFGVDCIIAFIVVGFTSIYLSNRNNKQ